MFEVAAEAYDRYMGRYSQLLAPGFADFAGVAAGQRVLDVGCGPGALTAELVRRLEPASVTTIDPSEEFVAAARTRHPGVDVRQGSAEELPFVDDAFDATLAQLVVHFMRDPRTGVREMVRVTRPGGIVAACVWDHAADQGPLSPFWRAARTLDPGVADESDLAGSRRGDLAERFRAAGLHGVDHDVLSVRVDHGGFAAWWEPLTLGVGPAGAYLATLEPDRRDRLREVCRASLPEERVVVTARAWAARGVAG
jgi:SAM-dependent methyltransferase